MLFILSVMLLIVAVLVALFMELPLSRFAAAHIPAALCLGACGYILLLLLGPSTTRIAQASWAPLILLVGAASGLVLFVPRTVRTGRALLGNKIALGGIAIRRASLSLTLCILGSLIALHLTWLAIGFLGI